MAEALVNGGSSTLNGAITNSATTVVIQTADIGKFPSSGTYRVAVTDGTNTEVMTVTGGQGTASLTVTRHSEAYAGASTSYAFASGSTIAQVLTVGGLSAFLPFPYVDVQHVVADGVGGGAFSAGSWVTRPLNSKVTDTASIAGLASNQITLPPGTYYAMIQSNAFGVNDHQARLRNITSGATLLNGRNARGSGSSDHDCSDIRGQFTLSVSSVLEVQHRCETTNGTDGFGRVTNFATDVELYAHAEFWKLA